MILAGKRDPESGEVDYQIALLGSEYEKLIAGEPLTKLVEFAGGIGEFTLSYKLKKTRAELDKEP